jgi:hypothetical protein
MSENSDILEFIAQCLLSHRADNTTSSTKVRSAGYIMDTTKTTLLKRDIQCTIHHRIFQESLDISYGLFEMDNISNSVEF